MDPTTKKCPLCAEEIKLEARVCRFCGARFMVRESGYCQNCHRLVNVDPAGKCATCGGEVVDRHIVSAQIKESDPPAELKPVLAGTPTPVEINKRSVSPAGLFKKISDRLPGGSKGKLAQGILSLWRLYFSPNGRIGRKTFLLEGFLPLAMLIAVFFIVIFSIGMLGVPDNPFSVALTVLASLVLLWVLLMLLVKRLHDLDKSGWRTLFWLTPNVGIGLLDFLLPNMEADSVGFSILISLLSMAVFLVQLIRCMFVRGDIYSNRYGPEPDWLPAARKERSDTAALSFKETLSQRRLVIAGVLGLVLVPLALFSLIRYFIDQNNLNQGLKAFEEADCITANARFDKVIQSWRLLDFGGIKVQALATQESCRPFLAAVEKQEAGDYANALFAFTDLVLSASTAPSLAKASREQIGTLFEKQQPSDLASLDNCPKLVDFQSAGLIPQPEIRLPELYFACANAYQSSGGESDAVMMHQQLLVDYPDHPRASESEKALLDDPAACEQADSLANEPILVARGNFIPELLFGCGQMYDTEAESLKAFNMYKQGLINYPDYPRARQAEKALLANPAACEQADSLAKEPTLAARRDFIPSLYYGCGQRYDTEQKNSKAFDMYKQVLIGYPNHALASAAEKAILANTANCEYAISLQDESAIAARGDFMPSLLYGCGQSYEKEAKYQNAVNMYEAFIEHYPNHDLASETNTALARALVNAAKAAGAGEISAPPKSGSTSGGSTMVIIQNDSPEKLRIVFSGPEARIVELSACSECTTYMFSPFSCPELGPIGQYTLLPGDYEVLVESISDNGVTPYTGNWSLVDGDEYSSCFYIIQSFQFTP